MVKKAIYKLLFITISLSVLIAGGKTDQNSHHRSKKKVVFELLFVVISLSILIAGFRGCYGNVDRYRQQRPSDYGPAKWVCEQADFWFEIEEEYHSPQSGKIKIDGVSYPCDFFFIHQTNQLAINVYADESSKEDIMAELWGNCTFSSSTLIVKVDTKRDTIFNGAMKELVFIRQEITETKEEI